MDLDRLPRDVMKVHVGLTLRHGRILQAHIRQGPIVGFWLDLFSIVVGYHLDRALARRRDIEAWQTKGDVTVRWVRRGDWWIGSYVGTGERERTIPWPSGPVRLPLMVSR